MGRHRVCVLVLVIATQPALAQTPPSPPAPAPPPASAADLARQGLDAFRVGNYEAAMAALEQSYQLEPKPDTLFALAQAERLANQCDKAVPHFRSLLDKATDLETAKLVERELSLCPMAAPVVAPPPVPAPPPPTPQVIERPASNTNAWLLGGGGALLGAGVALYLASRSDRDDAVAARSAADHDRIDTRADILLVSGAVAVLAGAGLAGYAIYRIRSRTPRTEVAVMPSTRGGILTISRAW